MSVIELSSKYNYETKQNSVISKMLEKEISEGKRKDSLIKELNDKLNSANKSLSFFQSELVKAQKVSPKTKERAKQLKSENKILKTEIDKHKGMIEAYKNQLEFVRDANPIQKWNCSSRINNDIMIKREIEEMKRHIRLEVEQANRDLIELSDRILGHHEYNKYKSVLRRKPLKSSRIHLYSAIPKVSLNKIQCFE